MSTYNTFTYKYIYIMDSTPNHTMFSNTIRALKTLRRVCITDSSVARTRYFPICNKQIYSFRALPV